MYIGPWQEYKLSKQRAGGASGPRVAPTGLSSDLSTSMSPDVLKELEKALKSTLDPVAAQAALLTMNRVLEDNAQSKGISSSITESAQSNNRLKKSNNTMDSLSLHLLEHQNMQQPGNHRNQPPFVFSDEIYTPRGNTPQDQSLVYNQDRRIVPPVVLSAREKRWHSQNQYSPLSVRSSKSEPVQSLPSLLNVTPAIAHSQYYSSNLTSKNLAINQQRLQQQTAYDGGSSIYSDKPVISSAPSQLPVASAVSGYDTGAVVNFLRRERNQRAKTEISKLTGWNILHGGVGVPADVRSSIAASDISGDSNKPPIHPHKDKATLLREKKIAEIEQRKAAYLNAENHQYQGNNDGKITNYTFSNTNYHLIPSENDPTLSIESRKCELNSQDNSSPIIPFPKMQEIEQFSDDHMLLVSKYFQDNMFDDDDEASEKASFDEAVGIAVENAAVLQEEGGEPISATDYLSLPLDGDYLIPTKSMAQLQNDNGLLSSQTSHATIETKTVPRQQQQQQHPLDDDFDLSRNVSNGSLWQPPLSQHPGKAKVESENSEWHTPRDELPVLFSPPDTAMGKVLATGSFMEDVTSGNLDSLLSWTRDLDKVNLDEF